MDDVSQHNIIFLSNRGSFFYYIAPYVDFFIDMYQYVGLKVVKITDNKTDGVVKSPIYCVVVFFQTLGILHV
jgi:hypothetical protein